MSNQESYPRESCPDCDDPCFVGGECKCFCHGETDFEKELEGRAMGVDLVSEEIKENV